MEFWLDLGLLGVVEMQLMTLFGLVATEFCWDRFRSFCLEFGVIVI